MPNHESVVPSAPAPGGDNRVRIAALLLSDDEELVSAVRDLGSTMSMSFDICSDLLQATRKVATTKYQGILVDYANEVGASALIHGVRGSTSNAADVVYAFVTNANQAVAARQAGANFIIPQPYTLESVTPYIRAGYGLMIHELRRYFRAPVVIAVDITLRDGRHLAAQSIDLSSGGLAVISPERLNAGQSLHACFQIPGANDTIEVPVTVCWNDSCRAGLRFEQLSEVAHAAIQRWLRAQIDKHVCRDQGSSQIAG